MHRLSACQDNDALFVLKHPRDSLPGQPCHPSNLLNCECLFHLSGRIPRLTAWFCKSSAKFFAISPLYALRNGGGLFWSEPESENDRNRAVSPIFVLHAVARRQNDVQGNRKDCGGYHAWHQLVGIDMLTTAVRSSRERRHDALSKSPARFKEVFSRLLSGGEFECSFLPLRPVGRSRFLNLLNPANPCNPACNPACDLENPWCNRFQCPQYSTLSLAADAKGLTLGLRNGTRPYRADYC